MGRLCSRLLIDQGSVLLFESSFSAVSLYTSLVTE